MQNHMDKNVFDQIKNCIPMIFDFLLPYTNDNFMEISLTVSECLSGLICIPFDYSKKLIDMATYTTINAIHIYMRLKYNRALTEQEKDEVISLVTQGNFCIS